ncbi:MULTISPECIES: sulfatase-like hydrolase/transferase [Rhizobium/Agrobacterium group]|uniref:sulfatase-like hydrolase/transferase n=1 Tax=Rhizobium/Agrobacterium group TaxID=227290 RepID=UPI002300A020|nr:MULTISPECIES: sulfatase-like hydrolase/transferase [Rhizobium/Agrobacterium group]MDA5635876.1 sulfatase-like hydrolase/transferase [Agrobacterium sp. ST15.16.024]MDF1892062.1 sulfatase-like hydrolase/transferase [Rhizobium rhizogenes]
MSKIDFYRNKRSYWVVWNFVFSFSISALIVNIFDFNIEFLWIFAISFSCFFVMFGFIKYIPNGAINYGWWLPIFPLLLFAIWYVYIRIFGTFSIAPVVFHLQYDMESNGVVLDVARVAFIELQPFILIYICWRMAARGDMQLQRLGKIVFLPLLVLNPFTVNVGQYLFEVYGPHSKDLDAVYVNPSNLPKPLGKQPNFVHIYLESTERTLLDGAFGTLASPLLPLFQKGFSANGIEQAQLTDWTLAGQVASLCGVPLLSLGSINRNDFDQTNAVLPNATCVSDLLVRDGYDLSFIKGAMLRFAGTENFVRAHNYQNSLGYEVLGHQYPVSENSLGLRKNPWGLDDEDMFHAAYGEVKRLANGNRPFAVTLTTIGGHTPKGYVSRQCETDPEVTQFPTQTEQAFYCTNKLTAAFLDRLEIEGLLENTVVILQSDHLAMRNELDRKLKKLQRRNSFFIFSTRENEGISANSQSDKRATMVDVFPTILESLGYILPDRRAGLGVSLFSEAPTLVGEWGLETFDRAILADWKLRERVWGLKRSETPGSNVM